VLLERLRFVPLMSSRSCARWNGYLVCDPVQRDQWKAPVFLFFRRDLALLDISGRVDLFRLYCLAASPNVSFTGFPFVAVQLLR
jgi:hypothetical protein